MDQYALTPRAVGLFLAFSGARIHTHDTSAFGSAYTRAHDEFNICDRIEVVDFGRLSPVEQSSDWADFWLVG